jgi:phosphomannomutase/phosphoglucomutase
MGIERLFGTAGIRGITNREISPEFTMKIAASYGIYLREVAGIKRPLLGVGFDTRIGADLLANCAASALRSIGLDVLDFGCIPTGTFSTNIVMRRVDGGILITGSHMPPERIGIIAVLGDGAFAPVDVTDKIEQIYRSFKHNKYAQHPQRLGKLYKVKDTFELYLREIKKRIDQDAIRSRRFKVLLDPANGTTGALMKGLFNSLGCRVKVINENPSPFPARNVEPRKENVRQAISSMLSDPFDLGICLDTDGDRVLFIDENAQAISEDTIGAIFALHLLKKGDICVTPINSSGLIELVCKRIGARLVYSKVGLPETMKCIKKLRASFGYEESGKYYFARDFLWSDGIYTSLKLMEILLKTGKRLSELKRELPSFYQVKLLVKTRGRDLDKIMNSVKKVWQRELLEQRSKDIKIDGLKRIYKDNSWLLIRASRTEPLIRIYSDAPSRQRATELVKKGEALLKKVL